MFKFLNMSFWKSKIEKAFKENYPYPTIKNYLWNLFFFCVYINTNKYNSTRDPNSLEKSHNMNVAAI